MLEFIDAHTMEALIIFMSGFIGKAIWDKINYSRSIWHFNGINGIFSTSEEDFNLQNMNNKVEFINNDYKLTSLLTAKDFQLMKEKIDYQDRTLSFSKLKIIKLSLIDKYRRIAGKEPRDWSIQYQKEHHPMGKKNIDIFVLVSEMTGNGMIACTKYNIDSFPWAGKEDIEHLLSHDDKDVRQEAIRIAGRLE